MHSNDARLIAQSLVIGKYVGDVSILPAVPGKDVVHKTPATDHTTPATDNKTPSDAGHHTTPATDHNTPADGSHHKPVPKPKPVDEKGYEYKKGPINVKPTDGWDNSSSYKFGQLLANVHPADLFKFSSFDDLTVLTPFHNEVQNEDETANLLH